jgi:hypothetical protein
VLEDSPERLIKDSHLAVPSTRGAWACGCARSAVTTDDTDSG